MKESRIAERTIGDFGEQWVRYPESQGFYASRELLEDVFGPLLSPGDLRGRRIVDLGAGAGRFTRMFVEAGASSVVALEPSEAFEVLLRNTSDIRDRVQCLRLPGHELPPGEGFDFVLSIGVLHHIPEPDAVVSAAFQALRPGGRLLVWLYGTEGNRLYLLIVRPVLALTRRLPHWGLAALVWMMYWPAIVYLAIAQRAPVPLAGYLRDVFGKLDPRMRRLVIYDQLNPAYARHYSQEEARGLLERADFEDVHLYHRHGYSWTAVGTRPGKAH